LASGITADPAHVGETSEPGDRVKLAQPTPWAGQVALQTSSWSPASPWFEATGQIPAFVPRQVQTRSSSSSTGICGRIRWPFSRRA